MTKYDVFAPLPGTISYRHADDGVVVEAGEPILSIECMKMMHEVTAPIGGVLRHKVELGGIVGQDDVVAEIEADE